MSKEFKMILTLIGILCLIFAGFFVWQQQNVEYVTTAHQSMEDLKAMGQVETKSYEHWSKKQKAKSTRFEQWRNEELKKRKQSNQ